MKKGSFFTCSLRGFLYFKLKKFHVYYVVTFGNRKHSVLIFDFYPPKTVSFIPFFQSQRSWLQLVKQGPII